MSFLINSDNPTIFHACASEERHEPASSTITDYNGANCEAGHPEFCVDTKDPVQQYQDREFGEHKAKIIKSAIGLNVLSFP